MEEKTLDFVEFCDELPKGAQQVAKRCFCSVDDWKKQGAGKYVEVSLAIDKIIYKEFFRFFTHHSFYNTKVGYEKVPASHIAYKKICNNWWISVCAVRKSNHYMNKRDKRPCNPDTMHYVLKADIDHRNMVKGIGKKKKRIHPPWALIADQVVVYEMRIFTITPQQQPDNTIIQTNIKYCGDGFYWYWVDDPTSWKRPKTLEEKRVHSVYEPDYRKRKNKKAKKEISSDDEEEEEEESEEEPEKQEVKEEIVTPTVTQQRAKRKRKASRRYDDDYTDGKEEEELEEGEKQKPDIPPSKQVSLPPFSISSSPLEFAPELSFVGSSMFSQDACDFVIGII